MAEIWSRHDFNFERAGCQASRRLPGLTSEPHAGDEYGLQALADHEKDPGGTRTAGTWNLEGCYLY